MTRTRAEIPWAEAIAKKESTGPLERPPGTQLSLPSRAMAVDRKPLLFDGFELDPDRFELRRDGQVLEIKPKTFDLLVYLVQHRGRLVSKDELFETIWPGTVVSEGSLSNAIYEARAALGDDAQRQAMIETVRGRGFRFVAAIEAPLAAPTPARPVEAAKPPAAPLSRTATAARILLFALGPNMILAGLNYLYNSSRVVGPATRADFETIVLWFNPLSFSLSASWILWVAWLPLKALATGPSPSSLDIRQRALVLGHSTVLIGATVWTAAGILYPTLLHAMSGAVRAEGTLHFFASLVLCGLAATAFPYFLITDFCVARIYPALGGRGQDEDRATLLRLRQLAAAQLVAAGAIPLLSVVLLSLAGEQDRQVLVFVGLFGLVGLGAALTMYRRLLRGLDAIMDSHPRA